MTATHYLRAAIQCGYSQPQTLLAGDPVRATPDPDGRWVSITGRARETGIVHQVELPRDVAERELGARVAEMIVI